MIPFFVVDRPISLEIIKGLSVPKGKKIGLMAHANTSHNFRQAFRDYPRQNTIKMCDSAIFNTSRNNTYAELYSRYENMDADYGVMIDVLCDSKATLKSAERALNIYTQGTYKFELVGVTQGRTVEEYLTCYERLRQMGFTHIAVGGLLQKRERSVRYMNVRSEELMLQILKRIRAEYNPEWLFVLGCLHPSRIQIFKELDVWGDYKGWIFEYKKRDEYVRESVDLLAHNHLAHETLTFLKSEHAASLENILLRRQKALDERIKAHKKLLKAKRAFQDFMTGVYESLKLTKPQASKMFVTYKSRGVINDCDVPKVKRLLLNAGVKKTRVEEFIYLAATSRLIKKVYVGAERKLQKRNTELALALDLTIKSGLLSSQTRTVAVNIKQVLETSEQSHRISQVHQFIEKSILNLV